MVSEPIGLESQTMYNFRTYTKLVVASKLILFAASAFAVQTETVKIGSATTLTGNVANLGKDEENGIHLAIDEINQRGLVIDGKTVKLELVSEDDAGDPRIATQIAQRLVDNDVVAVVGHMNSGTSVPASRIYSAAGVAQISPSATSPTYTLQGFKTTFRLAATDAQQGPALADYASRAINAKSVAIVDDATAYGEGLADEFDKAAQRRGIHILSRDAINDKSVDFRAILTKIKSERPDIIMFGGMEAAGAMLAKQAASLSLNAKIFAGDGVCAEDLHRLAGDSTRNIVCSIAGRALENMPDGAAFSRKYTERFNQSIQGYAAFSYDAVYVIADAMMRAKSTSRANILKAISATDYRGITTHVQFDSHGDLKNSTISIYDYENGNRRLKSEVTL
jgi:branched-chain amino acid transport system substrate-binding protein